MKTRLLVYGGAVLLGVATMLLVLPGGTVWGQGAGWHPPGPDQAQSLTGHLAFQADRWRWPLLDTTRLFWPQGISLALVDSNALVSILAKLWARSTGLGPANWLGAFLGVCWVMQPVAAVYAARGLRIGAAGALAAAVLAAAWPALMFRMMHINLCAHFLILLALGLTVRGIARPPGPWWWGAALGLLVVSVLTHPYLFQLAAAVLAAVPLQAALSRRPGWKREAAQYVGAGVAAVLLLVVLSGPIGGGDKGFTFFSMNLLSPVWAQRSGVFGADLPILDATGGQYEGFNWLGAGTILLLGVGGGIAAWRLRWPRPSLALVLVLAGLTLLSLSSVVYAGPVRLLNLGTKPWEDIFGSFRSAGRAFWPVGYAVMLGGVAMVDRLPRRFGWPVLAAAAALQVVDIGPLLRDARTAWSGGSGIEVPAVPVGTTLLTVAPHPGCAKEMTTKWGGPLMLLEAVRAGAQTGDIGLGRSPRWFSCERILSDALELPLLAHESRAFFGPAAAALRPALLGGTAVCRMTAGVHANGQGGAVTLCSDQAWGGEAEGPALPVVPLPAPLGLPAVLGPGALPSVLGHYWMQSANGDAWSEGPRSSLLIPVVPGRRLRLRLRASGVGGTGGEARRVEVHAGRLGVGGFSLPDGVPTEVAVSIPPSATASGMLRLAFDTVRPVDPVRRGLIAPVKRAAIVLSGVTVEQEAGEE